jgi:Fe-S-cluster-containing hydrogenase component 2
MNECPVAAIMDDQNEKNPYDDRFYVKPESCVECVGHEDEPRCAAACPTEGAIVWDMPYTTEFEEHFQNGNDGGIYAIRMHKKKGLMLPSVKEQPFIESITTEQRRSNAVVAV